MISEPSARVLGQLLEIAGVADVGEAEVVVRPDSLEAQLAGCAPDVAQAEAAGTVGVEDGSQNVGVELLGGVPRLRQIAEAPLEQVHVPGDLQPRLATHDPGDGVPGPSGVAQHAVKEELHFEHVAGVAPLPSVDRVHASSHEHPERPLQIVRSQIDGVLAVGADLLVEGEQVAEKKHVGVLGGRIALSGDVQDAEVLPEPVAVEVPVGVVEDDGLAVVADELRVARRRQRLAEGGAVFEGEAPRGHRVPHRAPRLAARAPVSLVHEHEVAVAESVHLDADSRSLPRLLLDQLGDLGHPHGAAGGLLLDLRRYDE